MQATSICRLPAFRGWRCAAANPPWTNSANVSMLNPCASNIAPVQPCGAASASSSSARRWSAFRRDSVTVYRSHLDLTGRSAARSQSNLMERSREAIEKSPRSPERGQVVVNSSGVEDRRRVHWPARWHNPYSPDGIPTGRVAPGRRKIRPCLCPKIPSTAAACFSRLLAGRAVGLLLLGHGGTKDHV
jgi:hypothetical protein